MQCKPCGVHGKQEAQKCTAFCIESQLMRVKQQKEINDRIAAKEEGTKTAKMRNHSPKRIEKQNEEIKRGKYKEAFLKFVERCKKNKQFIAELNKGNRDVDEEDIPPQSEYDEPFDPVEYYKHRHRFYWCGHLECDRDCGCEEQDRINEEG